MIPPRYLVISGGGIKVVSIVGSLKVLEEKNMLRNLKEISGVSAGAWLAFMLSCGLTVKKLEELILNLDFSVIRNFTPDAIIGFPETFGLDDGRNLVKFLESLIRVVLKMDPASVFSSLASKKIKFKCWAADLNTHTIKEYSIKATPNIKIIDALHASMSVPFYFTPVPDPETRHLMSDGGIHGSLPIHHLTDDEREQCLAVGFCKNDRLNYDAPTDLMGFANSIFSSMLNGQNEKIISRWEHKIVRLPVDEFPSWNFEASREDKLNLLKKGYQTMASWVASSDTGFRRVSRRYSI
jgi:predicted acylesterase/phospholipase RssA